MNDGQQQEPEDITLGEVTLGESGLSLPISMPGAGGEQFPAALDGALDSALDGVLGAELSAPQSQEITAADRADLARLEAELDERWLETKIDPSIRRIEYLMDLMGNPQDSFPSIHIAGTNGKTSTTRMVESLLRAFHRRTGRTTSPHLQLVTERIAIDGRPIHPRDLIRLHEEIRPYLEMTDAWSEAEGGPRLSKFEVLIALAYAGFADAPVDVAVVEVGLGGRWDATNVINAEVAVITPVGMDHTDRLGETLAEIAGEKAGIIKPRPAAEDVLSPRENIVIVGRQEQEAMNVILAEAVAADSAVARLGAEFAVVDSAVAVGGQQLTLQGLGGEYPEIFLPLSGAHQAENAAVALAAVEAFFGASAERALDLDTVRQGFAQVESPGRLERMRSAPTVFIDAAHNPHGAAALGAALERDFDFRCLIGVIGVLGDKDARGILESLEPHLQEVVCTQTTSERALDAHDLAEYAREIYGDERVHVQENLADAVELAIELAEDTDVQSGSGVLVTGSIVTAGEARTLFGKEPA